MLSIIMLRVIYAECGKEDHYAGCNYADCRGAILDQPRFIKNLLSIKLCMSQAVKF